MACRSFDVAQLKPQIIVNPAGRSAGQTIHWVDCFPGSNHIYPPYLTAQQDMDGATSVANPRLANLLDAQLNWGLSGAARLAMVSRGVELQNLAGQPDRYSQSTNIPSASLRFRTGLKVFADRRPLRNRSSESISSRMVLKHLAIQCQTRDDLLQSGIFILKRLQPAHLIGQQACILLAPTKIGRLTDPCLAANVRHRHTIIALFQNERLLRVLELRRLHFSAPFPARK